MRPETDETGKGPQDLALRLELVTSLCGNGTCPTVYRTNRDTVIVQGYAVSAAEAGVAVPEGELLVEIPADILRDAAQRHGP